MIQPGPVIDQRGNEEDDNPNCQPDNLPSPHFGEIDLRPHVSGAVNRHHPENGQTDRYGSTAASSFRSTCAGADSFA